ncbi:hypothetical protein BDP81DRAFT_501703 [Colletotrichum phormii]|uniref:Uncharacterized protein n=1 Tax=Colletotrichum phormii TaxID=359342 RepID=A0AAI9ZGR5_9PEZI|nr:uncharacterized protein BDP81DRAFT_501703 [Colletotrichum phormii]KAK1624161.1 hypothetical protein BDP81DRAFT_501703 [Colletotrichum phormii]
MSSTSAKKSIQGPTRSRPILKLDIASALRSEDASRPILIREYQSPVMSLASAKKEVSNHPLPEYLPDIVEQRENSRDRLHRSGDAGTHDYLHWALEHNGKQPRNSWDSCSCVGGSYEIDSDESEPMTEGELAQRRIRLQETYKDLEALTPGPVSSQLYAGGTNDEASEAIDKDLSDFLFVENGLHREDIAVENQNLSQTFEDAVGAVELSDDLQSDLCNATSVIEHDQESQTNGGTNKTVEEPEVGRRTRFHEHFNSLDAPEFRLSLAGLTPPQQSAPREDSNSAIETTISHNDSEHASTASRHKGIFIPAWLWCVLWITLIGFLIGFFIMMSLFIAFRHEGMLHVGKFSPCSTPQPCVCDISPSPFNGAHGMDERTSTDERFA